MPEIAEVRVVANTLKKQILNRKIKKVQILYKGIINGNQSDFVQVLEGLTLKDITTYGKWILFNFEDYTLLSHLRMEGKYFYVNTNAELSKHDHIIFTLDNNMDLRYNDVRKFGKMELVKTKDVFKTKSINKLGLEPDDPKLNEKYLVDKFKKIGGSIKTALLDQTIINGLGNIYANEVLFGAKINPLKNAKDINEQEARNIIENAKNIIEKSYELGGCTIRSYTSSLGVEGKFQNELRVHMKENKPCTICKTSIKKIKIDGRSTYYCEKCQKK